MPKLTIDNQEIEVANGTSVLQACEQLGIEIPRFCYHDRLSVPANCRMCLVEQEKAPKPIPSCAVACAEGMIIRTNTDAIKKARQGVMEMLLVNHPLDCPICDQGGECDLQDQAMAYGYDRSRYDETKRVVSEKELGPLVKTAMTRCIHCTRCVRFLEEIAGTPELGLTGRSENVEITTYVEKALTSELSGNIVDVCPVGALTSKPYAFIARPWELRKTDSIDVMDAVGSNIRIDSRANAVLRVLPRLNEEVNEEWLADKSRHCVDGLTRQRLDRPYIRENGSLRAATWDEAFGVIKEKIAQTSSEKIAALVGDLVDVETTFLLKNLMHKLGSVHMDCRQDGATFDPSIKCGWRFNTTIEGLEAADAILLIGTNPRKEAPLINARIRKRWRKLNLPIAVIGGSGHCDLTYPYEFIGPSLQDLSSLGSFGDKLKKAKNPVVIIGAGVFVGTHGVAIHAQLCQFAEDYGLVKTDSNWNGFNVLHTAAGRVGALEIGFTPTAKGAKSVAEILAGAQSGEIDFIYNYGADEIDAKAFGQAFVVYQGHHGDRGAHRADVILPGAAYTEKDALYVNTEGRAQKARQAVFPPGEAKEDWRIVRALSETVGQKLSYDSLQDIRKALATLNPIFAHVGDIVAAEWKKFGVNGQINPVTLHSAVENYYMTDPISRASETMARCVTEILPQKKKSCGCSCAPVERTGTHG